MFPKIFIPSLLIFTLFFLFGEIRTKFLIVEFNLNEISVKRYFGLQILTFKNSEIKGWKYSYLSSKYGTYEYLYLYVDDKKVVKISEFYHRNYSHAKNYVQTHFRDLGFEEFSLKDELKEIFK